jgi:hypothetical protein
MSNSTTCGGVTGLLVKYGIGTGKIELTHAQNQKRSL